MGLDSLQNGVGVIKSNSTAIIAGTAGLAGGAVLGATAVALSRRKKTKKVKRKSTRKTRTVKSKKRSKRTRNSRKRRYTSHKRIHKTKNGQPYIILANGRARFIKKSSAKRSRKLKGGRY